MKTVRIAALGAAEVAHRVSRSVFGRAGGWVGGFESDQIVIVPVQEGVWMLYCFKSNTCRYVNIGYWE